MWWKNVIVQHAVVPELSMVLRALCKKLCSVSLNDFVNDCLICKTHKLRIAKNVQHTTNQFHNYVEKKYLSILIIIIT